MAEALDKGKVFVNEEEASRREAGTTLRAGDVVRVWMDRPGSAKRRSSLGDARDLPIVFEDDQLIVLNKPAGVLAVPLVYNGWVQKLPQPWKQQLTEKQMHPVK